MAKIKFEELNSGGIKYLIILSAILILIGILKPYDFGNPKIYDLASAIGFSFQAIYFSRMFWYKNYVQWNKKGIVVKINSRLGQSLKYDKIRTINFNEDKFEVILEGEDTKEIDVSTLDKEDRKKLKQLLQQYAKPYLDV